jgi:hypothetical protein
MMQCQLGAQSNAYIHQVQTCKICCAKENFGFKSSYDSCNLMMDQDCKKTSKQDQSIIVMQ